MRLKGEIMRKLLILGASALLFASLLSMTLRPNVAVGSAAVGSAVVFAVLLSAVAFVVGASAAAFVVLLSAVAFAVGAVPGSLAVALVGADGEAAGVGPLLQESALQRATMARATAGMDGTG